MVQRLERRRKRRLKSGGGAGGGTGLYFWFRVIDRICAEDVDPYNEPFAGLIVKLEILSGTESPRPIRADGNYLVQDPCNLMGPYNYAQTSNNNKGKASLGYPIGSTEPIWVLDWLEVYPDCNGEGQTVNPL